MAASTVRSNSSRNEREKTDRDDDVVDHGDDGADANFHWKRNSDVREDHESAIEHRERALPVSSSPICGPTNSTRRSSTPADLRLRARWNSARILAVRRRPAPAGADEDVGVVPKCCDLRVCRSRPASSVLPYPCSTIRTSSDNDLEHDAAGEVHAEIEAAHRSASRGAMTISADSASGSRGASGPESRSWCRP